MGKSIDEIFMSIILTIERRLKAFFSCISTEKYFLQILYRAEKIQKKNIQKAFLGQSYSDWKYRSLGEILNERFIILDVFVK
jgi:hypothetical protein